MQTEDELQDLVARLREAAARLPGDSLPSAGPAQPWCPQAPSSNGLPASIANAWLRSASGRWPHPLLLLGLEPQAAVTWMHLVALGRPAAMAELTAGAARLAAHTPRTELLAEISSSVEARALPRLRWFWRCCLGALNALLHSGHPKLTWVVRGVLRRAERWARPRAAKSPTLALWHALGQIDLALARLSAQSRLAEQTLAGGMIAGTPGAEEATVAVMDAASRDFLTALDLAFRGRRDELMESHRSDYLQRLLPLRSEGVDGLCIDIGCGTGAWLQVLQQAGLVATGVDLNAAHVEQANRLGLDARLGDALLFLREQADGSALMVSALHVMEHLTLSQQLALLRECARALAPGGMLILETPNPENIYVATHTFHHDPTHLRPLTPDGLAFMVRHHGFDVIDVPRLHPYPPEAAVPGNDPVTARLNGLTCIGQDFAVIARKPRRGP